MALDFGLPTQGVHQPTDVANMVVNLEAALNQFRDTHRGPCVRLIAVRSWALPQERDQLASLASIEFVGATRIRTDAKAVVATLLPAIAPPHHRTGCAGHQVCHFAERSALAEQFQRPAAAAFQMPCRSSRPHDGYPPVPNLAPPVLSPGSRCIIYASSIECQPEPDAQATSAPHRRRRIPAPCEFGRCPSGISRDAARLFPANLVSTGSLRP